VLIRYNKKSVTLIAENGQRGNVHPGLLFKVRPAQAQNAADHEGEEGLTIMSPQPASKKAGK